MPMRRFTPFALLSVIALLIAVRPAPAEAGEALGKITARKGKIVTITVADSGPEAKTECELFKRFETKLGALKASGWLDVAKVVVEVAGSVMKLRIVEQKSKMKVNGKPVDHFKPGNDVKLTWK
jgi:hypothetical protein